MASLKDDHVNFDKLESSVRQAMEAENLYWLQNDAKFRAVKQKGSYDEFKEIVAAAHLKPLAKDEKIQLDEKIVSPWNTSARAVKVSTRPPCSSTQDSSLPSSSNEFVLQWRKLKGTGSRAEYLQKLLIADNSASHIAVIFSSELPFGLLGEFIEALSGHCTDFDSSLLKSFLYSLTTTGRFGLALTFLSSREKDSLNTLFQYLVTSGVCCDELQLLYHV
ncbi:coiled-coil domain-containing protein 103-like [Watersipora subatra]|uniref:coiled-coil domain-containing protein 103-like n=1 Tax=Watersipora subatra TaxID=2589382 RepID=UPI00355C9C9C